MLQSSRVSLVVPCRTFKLSHYPSMKSLLSKTWMSEIMTQSNIRIKFLLIPCAFLFLLSKEHFIHFLGTRNEVGIQQQEVNNIIRESSSSIIMTGNESSSGAIDKRQIEEQHDKELLEQAQALFHEERLLAAARKLRKVIDPKSYFTHFHTKLLENAKICEQAVIDLLSSPPSITSPSDNDNDTDSRWKKQGESHGLYDTTIYYKVDDGAKMTVRMESPIPSSLLVPLLSVLNESDLYETWIPSWTVPFKMGVRKSNKLLQDTRGHQIIQVQCNVPWPLYPREVIIDALAVDDIEEQGFIIIKMRTADENDDECIPPVEKNMDRIDFDGGILFRACPNDHPNFAANSKTTNEDLVLVQVTLYFDAHMSMVPQKLINFITRTVIGTIWNMFIKVAMQVKDGKRVDHKKAIESKQDFYNWVSQRTAIMLDNLKKQQQKQQQTQQKEQQQQQKQQQQQPKQPPQQKQQRENSNISDDTATTASTTRSNTEETDEGKVQWTLKDVMKITL